jgi:hypothetical protein
MDENIWRQEQDEFRGGDLPHPHPTLSISTFRE